MHTWSNGPFSLLSQIYHQSVFVAFQSEVEYSLRFVLSNFNLNNGVQMLLLTHRSTSVESCFQLIIRICHGDMLFFLSLQGLALIFLVEKCAVDL